MVLKRRRNRGFSVVSRSRSVASAPAEPTPRMSPKKHRVWPVNPKLETGNTGGPYPGSKRKIGALDDGLEISKGGSSEALSMERKPKAPRRVCCPSSLNTSSRKAHLALGPTQSRDTICLRTSVPTRRDTRPVKEAIFRPSGLQGMDEASDEDGGSSERELVPKVLGERLVGLKLEIERISEMNEEQRRVIDDLKKEVSASRKINRRQGSQIDKLRSTNKETEDQLNMIQENLQCQICLELLSLPHTLVPCGHVFCQNCLQNWFRSGHHQDESDAERLPTIWRIKTCPSCRSRVHIRPVPLFVLKGILCLFPSYDQVANENIPDSWVDIFPSDLNLEDPKGNGLSETDDFDTDDTALSSDEEYAGLHMFSQSESEDSDEEVETDADETSILAGGLFTDMQTPSWAPARFRREMTRDMFPDVPSQQLRLLQRGTTPRMIERYNMRFDLEEGLVAWTPHGAEVYLGWNIRLPAEDFPDGRIFMAWVSRNIEDEPDHWVEIVSEDHPTYRRLVQRWRRYEVLIPTSELEDDSEDDTD